MNKLFVVLCVLIANFLFFNISEAARICITIEVEPVIYNDIRYTAPHKKMGYIEAWDVETDKKLWELKVYDVKIIPLLELDLQWIIITFLSIEKGKLIVVNDRDYAYEVDLETKKVRKSLFRTKMTKLTHYRALNIADKIVAKDIAEKRDSTVAPKVRFDSANKEWVVRYKLKSPEQLETFVTVYVDDNTQEARENKLGVVEEIISWHSPKEDPVLEGEISDIIRVK